MEYLIKIVIWFAAFVMAGIWGAIAVQAPEKKLAQLIAAVPSIILGMALVFWSLIFGVHQ